LQGDFFFARGDGFTLPGYVCVWKRDFLVDCKCWWDFLWCRALWLLRLGESWTVSVRLMLSD
jgi:hypothetical protein